MTVFFFLQPNDTGNNDESLVVKVMQSDTQVLTAEVLMGQHDHSVHVCHLESTTVIWLPFKVLMAG